MLSSLVSDDLESESSTPRYRQAPGSNPGRGLFRFVNRLGEYISVSNEFMGGDVFHE